MIDLHCHILPGLDDGARTLEESLEMCRISFHDGIRTIVATPHALSGIYQNDRLTILSKVQELNKALHRLLSPAISLEIIPGADVHFSAKVVAHLHRGKALTIGEGGKFLLLEFPSQDIPSHAEVVIFELIASGVTPIISHPERNWEIAQRPKRYYNLLRMGCLGQVTAMSLTGGFGREMREVAERLLKNRLVQVIASDGHSPHERPPALSSAVEAAAKILGEEEARKMVTTYPQAILAGQRPNAPEPICKL